MVGRPGGRRMNGGAGGLGSARGRSTLFGLSPQGHVGAEPLDQQRPQGRIGLLQVFQKRGLDPRAQVAQLLDFGDHLVERRGARRPCRRPGFRGQLGWGALGIR
ncbi:MAG: hypothetical protein ACYTG0_34170 [Planctomycetota bacterium]